MSLFDFFFPQQAQASHLRKLADQGQAQSLDRHRQRLAKFQSDRADAARARSLEQRVEQLERDIGQAGLAIEALLELLEHSSGISRDAWAARIQEIDGRDGVADGRLTSHKPVPPRPKRPWPGS